MASGLDTPIAAEALLQWTGGLARSVRLFVLGWQLAVEVWNERGMTLHISSTPLNIVYSTFRFKVDEPITDLSYQKGKPGNA